MRMRIPNVALPGLGWLGRGLFLALALLAAVGRGTRTRFTRREAFCNFSFCAVVNSRCSVALALSRILLQFSGKRDEPGAGAEAGAGRRVQNLVLLPINATQV